MELDDVLKNLTSSLVYNYLLKNFPPTYASQLKDEVYVEINTENELPSLEEAVPCLLKRYKANRPAKKLARMVKKKTKKKGSRKLWVAPLFYRHRPKLNWRPPRSPLALFEEDLYWDPWRLFVGCIFHAKTNTKVAKPILEEFFEKWPTPEAATLADKSELEVMLQPMGLFRLRAKQIVRFSIEYLAPWTSPSRDLHAIGKYGEDAWRIFCMGDLTTEPNDKKLCAYLQWIKEESKEMDVTS